MAKPRRSVSAPLPSGSEQPHHLGVQGPFTNMMTITNITKRFCNSPSAAVYMILGIQCHLFSGTGIDLLCFA